MHEIFPLSVRNGPDVNDTSATGPSFDPPVEALEHVERSHRPSDAPSSYQAAAEVELPWWDLFCSPLYLNGSLADRFLDDIPYVVA